MAFQLQRKTVVYKRKQLLTTIILLAQLLLTKQLQILTIQCTRRRWKNDLNLLDSDQNAVPHKMVVN